MLTSQVDGPTKGNQTCLPLKFWVWLKINQEGLRRFWSMCPLTRVPFWDQFFEPQPNGNQSQNVARVRVPELKKQKTSETENSGSDAFEAKRSEAQRGSRRLQGLRLPLLLPMQLHDLHLLQSPFKPTGENKTNTLNQMEDDLPPIPPPTLRPPFSPGLQTTQLPNQVPGRL